MPALILASSSPYRKQLLARLGVDFLAVSPELDERLFDDNFLGMGDGDFAADLARKKAESLASSHPQALILAADQIATYVADDRRHLLHKPGTFEGSVAQLLQLAGQSHQLTTAVVLLHPANQTLHTRTLQQTLTMKSLGAQEVADYVSRDRPFDCVGAYRIESQGRELFTRIAPDDESGVMGFPLSLVSELLEQAGVGR